MIKTERSNIGGFEIVCNQFNASDAFDLLPKLGELFAPILVDGSAMADSEDIKALGPSISAMFAKLGGQRASVLAREILRGTSAVYEGKNIDLAFEAPFNMFFTGRLELLIPVLKFALETNYKSFLGAGLAQVFGNSPQASQ